MFLNCETDYAIRIVACLAQNGEKLDAGKISELTGVTQRYCLKILHKLTRGGIVKSFKGAKGGYVLTKEPEEITLYDVISLISGPVSFSRCQKEGTVCTHPEGACYFRGTFEQVSSYAEKLFKEATFLRRR